MHWLVASFGFAGLPSRMAGGLLFGGLGLRLGCGWRGEMEVFETSGLGGVAESSYIEMQPDFTTRFGYVLNRARFGLCLLMVMRYVVLLR
jgi:hypothetical protein